MIDLNPALCIRHGESVGVMRTPKRRGYVALLNQLPQLGVHHEAVFEPRPNQGAMAATMSCQPLRTRRLSAIIAASSKLRRAVRDRSRRRAKPRRDEKCGAGYNVLPALAKPIPSSCRPVRAGRAATSPASPSISARCRRRCPIFPKPGSDCASTSRQTAMSMDALITNMLEGFVLPGLFSGEKDGTKM